MARTAARFRARPAVTVAAQVADALQWPRSRPARLLSGDRASRLASLVLCVDEASLASLDAPADAGVLLATPPGGGDGRLGRRAYDPFVGSPDDVATWRRAERVVLDASLLLAGGRRGIDDRLAELLELAPAAGAGAVLVARPVTRDVAKLVGYVPADALEAVREAVFDVGAGTIGDYDRCSWSVTGTGTFRGGDGTNPTVGTRGEFEQVAEDRVEVVVPTHLVPGACRAFVAAHPYEEPAYDVIPLALPAPVGFGRVGRVGAGGGAAAWRALEPLDPQLTAHGRADQVAPGAACLVHAGPLRDVLDVVLREGDLALVIVSEASDAELELLEELDIAALVLDRARAASAFGTAIAGGLSRILELPVSVQGALAFPAQAQQKPGEAPAAGSIFDEPAPSGEVDYSQGTWRLHFDGGSRGNPGPAAYGWVLYDPEGIERDVDGARVGSTTNNVAEWTGLLRGLEHAAERGVRSLEIRGDSELVVKQVTGVYRVKNAALKPLAEQVAALLRRFDRTKVAHVYRADNARADELANEALDGLR